MVELNRGQRRTTVRPGSAVPASGLRAQADSFQNLASAAETFGQVIAEDMAQERDLFVRTEFSKFQSSVVEKRNELELKHEGNPEAIGVAMDAYVGERMKGLASILSDEDQKKLVLEQETARRGTLSVMFKHHGIRRERQNAEALEAATSLEKTVRTDIGQQIETLGLNATPDQIKEIVRANTATLKENAVYLGERGLLTPTQVAEVGFKMDKWAFQQWAVNNAAKIGVRQGMDAASQWLENLNASDFSYTPTELEALQDAARAEASEQTAGYEEGRNVILQNYMGALQRASVPGEVPPPPRGLDPKRAAMARNEFSNKLDGFKDTMITEDRQLSMSSFEVALRAAQTPEEVQAIPAPKGLDSYGKQVAELKRTDRINTLAEQKRQQFEQAGLIGSISRIEMASSIKELFNTKLSNPENPADAARLTAAFEKTLDRFQDNDKAGYIRDFKNRLIAQVQSAADLQASGRDWEGSLPSNELIDRLPLEERGDIYTLRKSMEMKLTAAELVDKAKTTSDLDKETLKDEQRFNLADILQEIERGNRDDLTTEDLKELRREGFLSGDGFTKASSALRRRELDRRDVLKGLASIEEARATGIPPPAEARHNMNKAFKEIFHPQTGALNPSNPEDRAKIVREVTSVGYVPDALRNRFQNVQNETREGLFALIDLYDGLSLHDVFNGNVDERHMWQELVTGKNVLVKNSDELVQIIRTHRQVGGGTATAVIAGKEAEMAKVTLEKIAGKVGEFYERRYADQTGLVSAFWRAVIPNILLDHKTPTEPPDAQVLWEHGGWSVTFGLTSMEGEPSTFNYRVTVAPEALAGIKNIADTHQSSSQRVISSDHVIEQAAVDFFKTAGLSRVTDRFGGNAVLTPNPPEVQYPNQAGQVREILAHNAHKSMITMAGSLTDNEKIAMFGTRRNVTLGNVQRAVKEGRIFVAPTAHKGPDGKILYSMFHRSQNGTVELKHYDDNNVQMGLRFTATAAAEAQRAIDEYTAWRKTQEQTQGVPFGEGGQGFAPVLP